MEGRYNEGIIFLDSTEKQWTVSLIVNIELVHGLLHNTFDRDVSYYLLIVLKNELFSMSPDAYSLYIFVDLYEKAYSTLLQK